MQVLDLDAGIDFGSRGNLHEFSPVGFSKPPDQVSTWTERQTAQLGILMPAGLNADLRITLQATPFLSPRAGVAQQRCWVFWNGLFVHLQTLRTPADIEFAVPREMLHDYAANTLALALPDAVSPNQLRMGADLRMLGLAIVKLTASEVDLSAAQADESEGEPAAAESRSRAGGGRGAPARSVRAPSVY